MPSRGAYIYTMAINVPATILPTREAPDAEMVWIPGGTFRMGSADFYPEERPDLIAEEARKLWATV